MQNISLKRFILISGAGLLLLPLIIYGWRCSLRPSQTNAKQKLFKGIVYQRKFGLTVRPVIIHVVTVDLSVPGVKVLVTPPHPGQDKTSARTTSQFLQEFQLQLAMNANYFHPFRENTPWDYYPHSGDKASVIGTAISNGKHYSKADSQWGALCISRNNRAEIFDSGKCPENTLQAVAGREIIVVNGKAVNSDVDRDKPYPRVVVATNQKGNILWLITIDGKQPAYSEGVTIAELKSIVENLGVYTALGLDGGGSTTLVMAKNNKPKLLNAPIHTKLPMRERPVANHLGFYADKL